MFNVICRPELSFKWLCNRLKIVHFVDKMNDVQMMTCGWGDRAWWVFRVFSLHLPDKEILGMSKGFPPRHAQLVEDLGFTSCNLMLITFTQNDHIKITHLVSSSNVDKILIEITLKL